MKSYSLLSLRSVRGGSVFGPAKSERYSEISDNNQQRAGKNDNNDGNNRNSNSNQIHDSIMWIKFILTVKRDFISWLFISPEKKTSHNKNKNKFSSDHLASFYQIECVCVNIARKRSAPAWASNQCVCDLIFIEDVPCVYYANVRQDFFLFFFLVEIHVRTFDGKSIISWNRYQSYVCERKRIQNEMKRESSTAHIK